MAVDQEKSIGRMAGDYAPGQFISGANVYVHDVRGRGGHATVYEVEAAINYDGKIERLGKRYALKVLHPHHATNSEMSKRLVTEAITLGKLNHPNVVQIFNAGFTEDKRAFILMELLEGINGRQLLRTKKRLPIENALEITRGLASGLAAAHTAGTIHQDIKPDNIFVSIDVRNGAICKLYDFGIQRRVDDAKSSAAGRDVIYEGTPVYSAPEQLQGAAVGPRSDLYAFGVVLFELLTGKRPFYVAEEEDERQARQRGRDLSSDMSYPHTGTCVIDAKLTQNAPKLSAFLPVPPELETLVAACLARDPTQRPESAEAIEKELGAILDVLDPFFKTAVETTQDLLVGAVRSVKPAIVDTMGIAVRGGDTVSFKEQPQQPEPAETWKPQRATASDGVKDETGAGRVATAPLAARDRDEAPARASEVPRDPRTLEGVLRKKSSSPPPENGKLRRWGFVAAATGVLCAAGAVLFAHRAPAIHPPADTVRVATSATATPPPLAPIPTPTESATPPSPQMAQVPAPSVAASDSDAAVPPSPAPSAKPTASGTNGARPTTAPPRAHSAPSTAPSAKPKLSEWLEH